MKFKVISFGKLKAPGLAEYAEHFRARLKPWASLEEIELKSDADDDTFLTKLGAGPKGAIYLLDERGKNLATSEWAEIFTKLQNQGSAHITFAIGPSYGFSEAAKKQATGLVSLGKQTLSHELARVVLLEQLYRVMAVTKGHPYHHA